MLTEMWRTEGNIETAIKTINSATEMRATIPIFRIDDIILG